MSFHFPSEQELRDAHARIRPFIHRTPIMTSRQINRIAGAELYFKCENFQKMGAFKMRGASSAITRLTDQQRKHGVVTHSSGNFAQALSLSASLLECTAHIVMPQNAPSVKKEAVRGYGGNIIESESTPKAREDMAEKVRLETGATFIHPSDDPDVINGNGSAAIELIEEAGPFDIVMAPVGGGGLVAGTAMAVHHLNPDGIVIGAEPSGADDAFRSKRDGVIYPSIDPQTICDGLRTNLGQWNFPIIQEYVDSIITVDDKETIAALKLIYERMKIIIEPSCSIVLAAILKQPETFAHKKVGVIISGGNVDFIRIAELFKQLDR